MRDKILALFEQNKKLTLDEIGKKIDAKHSNEYVQLIRTLNELEDERIILNRHSYYMYLDDNCVVGKVKDVSRYEFAVINKERKVYVEKKYAKNVFDTDEVLAVLDKGLWKVVHIYNRGIYRITGSFINIRNKIVFHSDRDFHREFLVKNFSNFKIKAGDKAVVKVIKYDDPMVVEIEEIIGSNKEKGVDITALLMAKNVRMIFSKKVEQEVKELPTKVVKTDYRGRQDLRFLQTVTIDGDDAKDFDDAISILKTDEGYTLFVHIADVSHYVKEGSAIDKEAYARCTSIYVCDRVVPMLPFELSNGICSLNENVERNTITCQMNIDEHGVITSYKVYPSVIYSDKRCTYNKINAVIAGDELAKEEYSSLLPMIENMYNCAKLLQNKSDERGNIEFSDKEPIIVLDKKGKAIEVKTREIGIAENIIEQFMISANVSVANYLNSQELPCMYRIHEDPEETSLDRLKRVCSSFGLTFEPEEITPKAIKDLLDSIEDETEYYVVSMMALRCMKKAIYSEECLGHFGLALEEYCHFTSPIRRYSDLVVHRMLRKYIFDKENGDVDKDIKKIARQAMQMSEKERDAVTVERDISDYKIAEYMSKHVGEVFEATIVSVLDFGFFVQLDNTIEGLVSIRSIRGASYDEENMAIRAGLITYKMGNRVKVMCDDVSIEKGQVSFMLVNNTNRRR